MGRVGYAADRRLGLVGDSTHTNRYWRTPAYSEPDARVSGPVPASSPVLWLCLYVYSIVCLALLPFYIALHYEQYPQGPTCRCCLRYRACLCRVLHAKPAPGLCGNPPNGTGPLRVLLAVSLSRRRPVTCMVVIPIELYLQCY